MLSIGFSKREMTPALGSPCALGLDNECEEIFDPPFLRAAVLEDEDTRLAFLTFDGLGFYRKANLDLRAIVARAAEVSLDNVVVHSTHSHESPNVRIEYGEELAQLGLRSYDPAYWDALRETTGAVIEEARCAAQPVRVSYGEAQVQGIASNRRIARADGKMQLRGARSEGEIQRAPEGEIDPMVRVLRFQPVEAGPTVAWIEYACHPASAGGDEAGYVAADFPGGAIARLREEADAEALYFTGCCGDINTGKYTSGKPHDVAQRKLDVLRMGKTLGNAVLAALDGARPVHVSQLKWHTVRARLPLRPDLPDLAAQTRLFEESVKAYTEARAAGQRMPGGGPLRGHLCRLLALRNAREGQLDTEVSALWLGDVGLVFLPGECFLAVAKAIRRASPGRDILCVENCDYYVSYVPTPPAYEEGGYEPGVAMVSPNAFARIVDAGIEALTNTGKTQ